MFLLCFYRNISMRTVPVRAPPRGLELFCCVLWTWLQCCKVTTTFATISKLHLLILVLVQSQPGTVACSQSLMSCQTSLSFLQCKELVTLLHHDWLTHHLQSNHPMRSSVSHKHLPILLRPHSSSLCWLQTGHISSYRKRLISLL